MLLNPEAVLLPLIDVKTGEAIESFPQDLEAFYQLDSRFSCILAVELG
jgi:hypothetical protein